THRGRAERRLSAHRGREDPAPRRLQMTNRKLVAWCALVGVLAAIGYSQRFTAGKPPRNALYHYDIAIGELITYLVIFSFFLWIAHGLSWEQLGIRKPRSWPRAIGLGALIFICVFVAE